jgi:hypothetical protein
VVKAKVLAVRLEGGTGFSSKNTWKADLVKATGCYEMRNVASGTYRVRLNDDRFAYSEGPVQGEVRLGSAQSIKVDLTTNIPNTPLLIEGVGHVVRGAATGFQPERELSVTEQVGMAMGAIGSAWPARVLSGFRLCTVHYLNDSGGPRAAEWCRIGGFKKADIGLSAFDSIRTSVERALTTTNLKFGSVDEPMPGCAGCAKQAQWRSPLNGVVILRAVETDRELGLQLWVIYNRQAAERYCSNGALPVLDTFASDPTQIADEFEREAKTLRRQAYGNLLQAAFGNPALVTPLRSSAPRGADWPASASTPLCSLAGATRIGGGHD